MSSTDLVELTVDLYQGLNAADPTGLRPHDWRRQVEHIQQQLRDADVDHDANVLLGQTATHLDGVLTSDVSAWHAAAERHQALIQLVRRRRLEVPKGLHLTRLKPGNLIRNGWHVANGLWTVALYEWLGDRWLMFGIAGAALIFFGAYDMARRVWPRLQEVAMKTPFGWILRPEDKHITPSSTWYTAAMMIGVVLVEQHAIELGVIILTFGDPAAALAGKRWGKQKLFRDRTLVGSTAYFVAATIGGTGFLLIVGYAPSIAVSVAAAVGLLGALTELVSDRVDDNFTVPLLCGGVAAFLLG